MGQAREERRPTNFEHWSAYSNMVVRVPLAGALTRQCLPSRTKRHRHWRHRAAASGTHRFQVDGPQRYRPIVRGTARRKRPRSCRTESGCGLECEYVHFGKGPRDAAASRQGESMRPLARADCRLRGLCGLRSGRCQRPDKLRFDHAERLRAPVESSPGRGGSRPKATCGPPRCGTAGFFRPGSGRGCEAVP